LSLNRYLIERDKFAPPEQERAARPALSRVEKPSLMTRSSSSAATPTTSNGITEVEAAIAAGFPWVSLEVELTSDLVPVLSHDSKARTREGTELKLASKTLRELENTALQNPIVTLRSVVERFVGKIGLCLELKRQEDIFQTLGLARETIKVLASLPPDSRIVLDSSSHTILATLEEFSHWPLGYDLPRKNVDPAWLDFAAERSFDWVYVDGSFITADAIRRAHQLGLKVMMLDVHDPALLGAIGAELPDGIRTDTAEPWQTQSGKNWLKP
jgi:glycerophosphoryl diester phosphodiesterase